MSNGLNCSVAWIHKVQDRTGYPCKTGIRGEEKLFTDKEFNVLRLIRVLRMSGCSYRKIKKLLDEGNRIEINYECLVVSRIVDRNLNFLLQIDEKTKEDNTGYNQCRKCSYDLACPRQLLDGVPNSNCPDFKE